jgi:hypothetical protein
VSTLGTLDANKGYCIEIAASRAVPQSSKASVYYGFQTTLIFVLTWVFQVAYCPSLNEYGYIFRDRPFKPEKSFFTPAVLRKVLVPESLSFVTTQSRWPALSGNRRTRFRQM